jgi:hypothetical protein
VIMKKRDIEGEIKRERVCRFVHLVVDEKDGTLGCRGCPAASSNPLHYPL